MKKQSTKRYGEIKFKLEYLKAKRQIEEMIEHSENPDMWILPKGSSQLSSVLKFTLEMIEENYQSYELKLHQLVSLIHLLEEDCKTNKMNADFRGELYNISSDIIHNTNHYEEWKHFSLAINDQYLM